MAREKKACSHHLSVCWGVYDVIHWGRGSENRHVSSFEMLDPVTELCPIQTGHYYGVDQLAWEQRGEEDKACHLVYLLNGMCYSKTYSPGIKPTHSWRGCSR